MKRIFIVHGWESHPGDCWFPWLKRALEREGFRVEVPPMPSPSAPEIGSWTRRLSGAVGTPDPDTYLVGHSIGVQTILRYLETLDAAVGGVVAVAGFFTLDPKVLDDHEDAALAGPWLTRPIDDAKVRASARHITAIFSDDDPFVPIENERMFRERLQAKTFILHGKGHFSSADGVTEEPLILEEVLKLMA